MTELSQAYGFNDYETYVPQNDMYEEKKQAVEKPVYKEPVQQKPVQQNVQQYAPQQIPSHDYSPAKRNTSYSFGDRMSMKRSEVIKLAIFSLVIVLGIAIDRIGTHYISKYLSDNMFSDLQEFMIRLSYPVVIFLVLWIVKSL